MKSPIECRVLCPELGEALADFFHRLASAGAKKFFHPHPLTAEEAARLSAYRGRDLYCVLLTRGQIVAYGMLRGWDEGFDVPSLGLAVDPAAQGRGYGRCLMEFLHAATRPRGTKKIRLKVHPHNVRAIALYESMGYKFTGEENGQLVAFLEL